MEAIAAAYGGGDDDDNEAKEVTCTIDVAAEEHLLNLCGSDGGVLSFLASCPPCTRLKIHRKFFVAADLEEAESEDEFHHLTRNCEARVGTRSKDGKWSINEDAVCWIWPTFTWQGDIEFSHGDLVRMMMLMFAANIFICQQQPGVWVLCDATDFMDFAEPTVCCLSRIQDETHQYLSLSKSVSAALAIKVHWPDDGEDVARDPPQVTLDLAPESWPYVNAVEYRSELASMEAARKVTVEYRSGHGTLEGHFVGRGDTLGVWDEYTDFWSEASSKLPSLWLGVQVETPGAPYGAVFVRILSGKKAGGAKGNQQACYVCLLYKLKCMSGSPWLYATMPNVSLVWDANAKVLLEASEAMVLEIEKELKPFTPTTVSGATQQAGNAIRSAHKRNPSA